MRYNGGTAVVWHLPRPNHDLCFGGHRMTGKMLGLILMLAGLGICIVGSLFLGSGLMAEKTDLTAAILGFALLFVFLVLPLVGVGGFLTLRGQQEVKEMAEVEKEKKILNVVSVQGKASLATLALELNATLDQVKNWVYDLVGKGLFTGYIDWKSQMLFAKDAAAMQTTKCPNCGGVRELVGKGVVKCPYCGAELFIKE
jgi:DNA-directed RNA polymerase subunit RPC12/RpoP